MGDFSVSLHNASSCKGPYGLLEEVLRWETTPINLWNCNPSKSWETFFVSYTIKILNGLRPLHFNDQCQIIKFCQSVDVFVLDHHMVKSQNLKK